MNTAITKTNNSIVMPAVSADEAVNAFNTYQELAQKITTPDDVQNITVNGQNKPFKKKSFWRKCQRFFNLSLELISERKEESKGAFTYFVMYRAVAPNGAHCDGDGACTSNEKNRIKTEHDTRATAHTRAKNRAIADLVAFGEVSAEEINGETVDADPEWVKDADQSKVVSPVLASPKQVNYIAQLLIQKGQKDEDLKMKYKVTSKKDLTKDQASVIIENLLKLPDEVVNKEEKYE